MSTAKRIYRRARMGCGSRVHDGCKRTRHLGDARNGYTYRRRFAAESVPFMGQMYRIHRRKNRETRRRTMLGTPDYRATCEREGRLVLPVPKGKQKAVPLPPSRLGRCPQGGSACQRRAAYFAAQCAQNLCGGLAPQARFCRRARSIATPLRLDHGDLCLFECPRQSA